jgi:hypothetical protein
MESKELKYAVHLDKLPNCPPITYKERYTNAFRWVFKDNLSDSFMPLNLLKEPPQRMLDDTDLLCKGFGLSLFDTFVYSEDRYKALYKRKRNVSHEEFIVEKGNAIAELMMKGTDGKFGDWNETNGHFTFHEFESTNLTKNVLKIEDIFDNNGNFKR